MSFQHDPAVWYDVSRLQHAMLIREAEQARMVNRVQQRKGWSLVLFWPFWQRQSQPVAQHRVWDGLDGSASGRTVSVTHA
jgi:hypothetical protein